MVSVMDFARQNGFMPATVVETKRRRDTLVMETLDPDPDTDIIVPDDGEAYRRGE